MHEIEDIRSGLQQLGSDVAEINAIVEDEPGSWQIFFEDGYAISINFIEERKTIELVAVLGTPEPDHELEVLRTMLCYQLLWRGRSQPRIAIDAAQGALMSLCEFDADLIKNHQFEEHILSFWMQALGLTQIVLKNTSFSLPPASAESMYLHA
jgi:hypothetical protein